MLESIVELISKMQNANGETISDQDSQDCLETDYLILETLTWKDSPSAEMFGCIISYSDSQPNMLSCQGHLNYRVIVKPLNHFEI